MSREIPVIPLFLHIYQTLTRTVHIEILAGKKKKHTGHTRLESQQRPSHFF